MTFNSLAPGPIQPVGLTPTYFSMTSVHSLMTRGLVVLPQRLQVLGIGAAVPDHVVAALFDLLDDVRVVVADRAVEKNGGRKLQLVEDLEQAPVADPVAVVAPGPVARGLRAAAVVRVHAEAGAEREMLDVEGDVEREPLAPGPGVVPPLGDRQELVASVTWQLQHGAPLGLSFSALRTSTGGRNRDHLGSRQSSAPFAARRSPHEAISVQRNGSIGNDAKQRRAGRGVSSASTRAILVRPESLGIHKRREQ